MKVYQKLADLVARYQLGAVGAEEIERFCVEHLPHGSGFDDGCGVDLVRSTRNYVVISATYHVMEDGYYTEQLDIEVAVKPDLVLGYVTLDSVHHEDGHRCKDDVLIDDLVGTIHSYLDEEIPLGVIG